MQEIQLLFALGITCIAGILILWLYLFQLEGKVNRLLDRQTPEFPDLTTPLRKLHDHVSEEAATTRGEAVSHSKNSQTAVQLLTGVVGEYLKSSDTTRMAALNTIEDDGKQTRKLILEEHKKTRKESQELKTRLTWSRKRELLEIEEEKAAKKATMKTAKPKASKQGGT